MGYPAHVGCEDHEDSGSRGGSGWSESKKIVLCQWCPEFLRFAETRDDVQSSNISMTQARNRSVSARMRSYGGH